MIRLPLYGERSPAAIIETVEPLRADRECKRCELGAKARTVCMKVASEGGEGGLLLVGEHPGKLEDEVGRPFVGKSGALLRQVVSKWWDGPVAVDNAVRCYPKGKEVKPKHVEACRPYLARTLQRLRPQRIVVLGGKAALSFFGRAVPMLSTRRGYGWIYNDGDAIPVYFVMHPAAALRNDFLEKWFRADLKWALTTDPPKQPPWDANCMIVRTPEDAREAVKALCSADWSAVDVETAGRMFDPSFEVISLAACPKGSDVAYVWEGKALRRKDVVQPLLQYLASPFFKKLGQNFKYDMLAIRTGLGVVVQGIAGDTRLWRRMQQTDADGKLAKMAELIGMGGHKEEADTMMKATLRKLNSNVRKFRKEPQKWSNARLLEWLDPESELDGYLRAGGSPNPYKYALLPTDVLQRYNALDAVSTARLGSLLESRLEKDPRLRRVWDVIVEPANRALEQVEAWGVRVDADTTRLLQGYLEREEERLAGELRRYGEFNPNSAPQIRRILFDQLKLPKVKLTDTGQDSTDKRVLEALSERHPLPKAILDFRKVTKMRGTYADGILAAIAADSRIHPNFKLDGAGTGRVSCTDPNLQNIPRAKGSEVGKMIRNCFVSSPGFVLLESDYSQIELRIAAMLSGDPEMIAIFEQGIDYHRRTAEMIAPLVWKVKWGALTPDPQEEYRSKAKAFNFGLLYGMSDYGLAKGLNPKADFSKAAVRKACIEEAERIREAILGKFTKLASWIQECLSEARATGEAWTWWDGQRARRRALWRIADKGEDSEGTRETAENGSFNTPVQGTSNEFCLRSLTQIVEWILAEDVPSRVVLTVHDSIIQEVEESAVEEVAYTTRQIMLRHNSMGVPLDVDFKVGRTWGALTEFKSKYAAAA